MRRTEIIPHCKPTLTLALALVLTCGLAGCNGTSETTGEGTPAPSPTEQEADPEPTIVTPKTAVEGERSLWFRIGNGDNNDYDTVSKDALAYLFVFENGNLSYKSNWSTQIGKLGGLSDEEIIALYQDGDAEVREKLVAGDQSTCSYFDDVLFEMEAPLPVATVELHTDETGNTTEKELLFFDNSAGNYTWIHSQGNSGDASDIKLWFQDPTSKPFQIYDQYYGGYKVDESTYGDMWFVTQIPSGSTSIFELDAVGTEGTEAH